MIKYETFNPINGSYTPSDSLQAAQSLQYQYQQDFCAFQNVGQAYNDPSFYINQQQIANEFIAVKTGIVETTFNYRVYNATTEENISEVFVAEDSNYYLIKVSGNQVTEWYQKNGQIDGITYDYVSLDLITDQPIEYYIITGSLMSKYSLDGTLIVTTTLSGYQSIPEDKKPLLDNFSYINNIFAWSDKYYGFIVEYFYAVYIPYNQCTPEQKLVLDSQKNSFIEANKSLFVINQVDIDDAGNATWTVVS